MLKLLFTTCFFLMLLFAANDDNLTYIKQKIEIRELKQELNKFYNEKETEYKQRKKELETLLSKIKKEKMEIKTIRDNNLEILKNIKGEVQAKTAKIYNGMKPKVSAEIFNTMINEGNIKDVFDIILQLKEKQVTLIMKFLSVKNASQLTMMLKNYKQKEI